MDQLEGSTLLYRRDYLQERSIEMELILEPGNYMIVPRSTGCNLKRPDNTEDEQIRLMDS